MLADKNYDDMLIGDGFWTLLEGIILRKKNHKVLIIEDKRVQMGNLWTGQIGRTEKELLISIGKQFNIKPLIYINKYLMKGPCFFVFDKIQIFQGNEFKQNILELMRKFPGIYETINQNINIEHVDWAKEERALADIIKLFAAYILGEQSQHGAFVAKVELFPPLLKGVFNFFLNKNLEARRRYWMPFINNYSSSDEVFLQWLVLCQGFYHFKITNWAYQDEIIHFILTTLSQRYFLNQKQLMIDLTEYFLELDGQIKETSIKSWQVDEKKIHSIELSSYEGLINPQRTSFFGKIAPSAPFKVSCDFPRFNAVKLKWCSSHPIFKGIENFRYYITSFSRLGTDFPADHVFIENDHTITFETLVPEGKLTHKKYYLSKVEGQFLAFLKRFFQNRNEVKTLDNKDFELCESFDQWNNLIDLVWDGIENRKNWTLKTIPLYCSRPGKLSKIRDLKYVGPLKYLGLGPLVYYKDIYSKKLPVEPVLQENRRPMENPS